MKTQIEYSSSGHLTTRPSSGHLPAENKTGTCSIQVNNKREALLYVPSSYHHTVPAALAVLLHGSGGEAEHGLSYLQHYARENNIILLAPASQKYTWDIIAGKRFGPDVQAIDEALSLVFRQYNIDSSCLAIGGFSDGASYALSIGLGNGDLFTHIIAFSPGFYYTKEHKGQPRIFISHGTNDTVLPIKPCSEKIVPALKKYGYDVRFEKFEGGHEIPQPVAEAAMDFYLKQTVE